MIDLGAIQIDLIKLVSGERRLRLTEPQFGLSLEKKLDASQPVVRQKQRLLGVFEAAHEPDHAIQTHRRQRHRSGVSREGGNR